MKLTAGSALFIFAISIAGCASSKKQSSGSETIRIKGNESAKRYDVSVGDKAFTSFRWPDSIFKPVLYPIINASGTEITRGYPLDPKAGERIDHPHHVGMWFNYGNVNGIDFWGNSLDIPAETRNKTGGTIKFLRAEGIKNGKGKASMTVYASWQDPSGKELLYEKTSFDFITKDSLRIIDRITTLTATGGDVSMPDTKEGMFAIRVARQLELPSQESVVLTDAAGNPTTVAQMTNEGVVGNYLSSEGDTGEAVWGKRARWMNLYGVINQDSVSVIICDHPKNPSYPTYWHARGYGLFSVNPLGAKDFTEGATQVNFSIPANQSATFRYRTVISSQKHLDTTQINALTDEFGRKY